MTRVIVTTHLLESSRHYPNRFLVAEVADKNIGRIDGVLEFGKPKERL